MKNQISQAPHTVTFKQQSQTRQQLIRLMQRVNFGEIRGLIISNGEPLLSPLPVTVRAVKFGAENGARAQVALEDFVLKEQVVQFLDEIADLSDGEIESVEIKAGLPFMATIRG